MGSASLRSVLTGVVTFVVVSCLTWGLCEWMTVREPRRLQARAGPRGVGPPRPLRAATVTPVAPQADTPCLGMDPADAQLALADRVRGLRVVTTFDCLPLEVRAHLRGPGTEDVTVTAGAAIYRADGSLLCGAEWTRIPGDCAGWVRLRVTSPRPMHAGESYTVAVHIRDAMSCVACGEGDDGCSASPRSTGLSRWPARMVMQPDGHTYAITCAVEPIPEFTPSTS
ncbi:MAG: hypothetical protein U9R79_17665 [Armatimonadota bacterium]|nr:hypothetical protein [Armatimonadota bacterium]